MNPAVRRLVLAEFRGYAEPSRENAAVAAGECVEAVLRRLGMQESVDEAAIQAAWAEVAGAFLARHCHPASLKAGTLSIRVVQPTLRFELERSAPTELLPRLQERFGARVIRRLQFRVG